jgi:aldehyde:ferredoxin oxidoreductase
VQRCPRRRPDAGATLDRDTIAEAIQTYYRLAGWDPETENPPRETLEELDLAWVADEIGV